MRASNPRLLQYVLLRTVKYYWLQVLEWSKERLTKTQNSNNSIPSLSFLVMQLWGDKSDPPDDRFASPFHAHLWQPDRLLHRSPYPGPYGSLQVMQSKGADLQICDSCLMGEVERSGHILAVCLMATQTPVISLKWFWQKINLEIQTHLVRRPAAICTLGDCVMGKGAKWEEISCLTFPLRTPSPYVSPCGSLTLVAWSPPRWKAGASTLLWTHDAVQLSFSLPKCHVSTMLYEIISNMLLSSTNSTV